MSPYCLLLSLALSLSSCIIGTSESPVAGDFVRFIGFMKTFNKTYRKEHEYVQRYTFFKESLRRHERLNNLSGNASGVARYGVTTFSDLSTPEFEGFLGLERASVPPRQILASQVQVQTLDSLPARFDWREKGVITAVKDQKSCGGCWAFSCVEILESAAVHSGQPLRALSEQQVLDCSRHNYGCSGGHVLLALKWLNQTGVRVVEDSRYPFVGAVGPCRNFSSSTSGVRVRNYYWRNYRNCEKTMQAILLKEGPLAITVDALSWQDYLGGIIQHHCSETHPNHAVVVVGYDTTGEIPYWIVRNSWGAQWGISGYVHIRMFENVCGENQNTTTTNGPNYSHIGWLAGKGFVPNLIRSGWPCLMFNLAALYSNLEFVQGARDNSPTLQGHCGIFNIHHVMLADWTPGLTSIRRMAHLVMQRPARKSTNPTDS